MGTERTRVACVEYRWHQDVSPFLDAIAAGCKRFGYRVHRWTHDEAQGALGRVPPVPCDVAFVWHGLHPVQSRAVAELMGFGARIFWVEYAWWDRGQTIQIADCGTNGLAHWAHWPDDYRGNVKDYLPVKPGGHLLVTLQGEYDGHCPRISPWFKSQAELVKHLADHSRLPVIVRPHPWTTTGGDVLRLLNADKRLARDDGGPIERAVAKCAALATLSSQCGVIAMERGKPVLCYGRAAYRRPGAVYCMDDRASRTAAVTANLAAGHCNLSRGLMRATLRTLKAKQFRLADFPACLEPLLTETGPT